MKKIPVRARRPALLLLSYCCSFSFRAGFLSSRLLQEERSEKPRIDIVHEKNHDRRTSIYFVPAEHSSQCHIVHPSFVNVVTELMSNWPSWTGY